MEIVPAPATLKERADEIRALDPAAQTENFNASLWEKNVRYREVDDLVGSYSFSRISRQSLFALGESALVGDTADRRRLLVGTLMWGYGSVGGRGYTNANRVLAVRDLDRKLERCADAVRDSDISTAYGALGGLRGYRSPFFTKYLYFHARQAPWRDGTAKPLILDSRVEDSLEVLRRALGVRWDKALPKRHSPVTRYVHYCETAQAWAKDLGLEPGVEGAEKIEQFLFRPDALRFDVYEEMRRLALAVRHDYENGVAGPCTSAAAQAMNTDLIASLVEFQ